MNKCPLDCTAIDRYMYDIRAILIYMWYILAGRIVQFGCAKVRTYLKKTILLEKHIGLVIVANFVHCGIYSNGQHRFLSFLIMCNVNNIIMVLWKTMPGRVKQVPQDSSEWDRTDTGQNTDKHLHVWSRYKLLFWTPLVISYKKYIYWKLFMRFH